MHVDTEQTDLNTRTEQVPAPYKPTRVFPAAPEAGRAGPVPTAQMRHVALARSLSARRTEGGRPGEARARTHTHMHTQMWEAQWFWG